VVDTAQALLIQQASSLIAGDLERLAEVLERRAWEFKDTPMIAAPTASTPNPSPLASKSPTGIQRPSATSPASRLPPKICA